MCICVLHLCVRKMAKVIVVLILESNKSCFYSLQISPLTELSFSGELLPTPVFRSSLGLLLKELVGQFAFAITFSCEEDLASSSFGLASSSYKPGRHTIRFVYTSQQINILV